MAEPDGIAGTVDFKHWADEGLKERSFERWKELRAELGRSFDVESGLPSAEDATWRYLTTYEDILDALRDYKRFARGTLQPGIERGMPLIPAELDPPDLGKYRALLLPPFSAAAVREIENNIRQHCRALVERFVDDGHCDFVSQFSTLYPTGVFMDLMGIPQKELPEYARLMEIITRSPLDDSGNQRVILEAEQEVAERVLAIIAERKATPGDDLVSQLIAAKIDGAPMPLHELLSMCMILLRGGLDTVVTQLAHLFAHLAQTPALRQRIVEEPESVPKIVEESLRFHGITVTARRTASDMEVGGCPIREGRRVILPIGAANRDPSKFPDPDRFDPDRRNGHHIAFGAGPHSCIGIHLAKAELRIALEEWHRLIPEYRIENERPLRYFMTDAFVGVEGLKLEWDVTAFAA